VAAAEATLAELRAENEALAQRRAQLVARNGALRLLRRTAATLAAAGGLGQALEPVRAELDADACTLWLVEPRVGTVVCRRAVGPARGLVEGRRVRDDEGAVGWVVQHAEGLCVADGRAPARDGAEATLRASLWTPLRLGASVLGALAVHHRQPGRFAEDDLPVLAAAARPLAVALGSSGLGAAELRGERRLQRLLERLGGVTDVQQALFRAADDIIFIQEPTEGRYLLVHLPERYGMPSDAAIGRLPEEVVGPTLGARFRAHMERVVESGEAHVFEDEVDWHGERLAFMTATAPVKDEAGRVDAVLGIGRDISERKRMEHDLAESRDRLRSLFSESPVGYVLFDGAGTLIDANPAALDVLAVRRLEDIMGLNLLHNPEIDPADRERLVRGEVVRLTYRLDFDTMGRAGYFEPMRGGVVHQDWLMAPLEPSGYLLVIEDVTEQREAQKALAESEERFRAIFEESPLGLFVFDGAEALLSANEAGLSIFGARSVADIAQVKLLQHGLLQSADRQRLAAGEVLRGTSAIDLDRVRQRGHYEPTRSGVLHTEWLVAPLSPSGYLVQVEDVTQEREALASLRASEERYRTLVEMAPEMMVVQLGDILAYINPAGARMLGVEDPQELIGRSAFEFLPAESHRRAKILQQRLAEDPHLAIGPMEQRLRLPDGREFEMLLVAASIVYEGRPAIQLILWDVSEQRRAERLAAQAKRLAELDRLTSRFAHEVRNPLQTLRTGLDYLRTVRSVGEERRESLRLLQQEVQRLARMTARVREMGRPEHEEPERFSLAGLLEQALRLVDPQVQARSARVEAEVEEGLPPMVAIRDQILQVLLNLLTNALEALPDGGRLGITLSSADDRIRLEVVNDGEPLPAEDLERLFEPFFSRRAGGSGLGLYICRSIVRRHGGSIRAANRAAEGGSGPGVVLTVTLPVEAAV
jgi:two-component system sporulation sensor kinase A